MLLAASVCVLLATCAAAQRPLPGPAHLARAAPGGCSVADFGAVPDNKTDNTAAFRAASRAERCSEILVPAGVWLTGPFNLSSHTTLNVVRGATISGSMDSAVYPVVTQQPEDEAYVVSVLCPPALPTVGPPKPAGTQPLVCAPNSRSRATGR